MQEIVAERRHQRHRREREHDRGVRVHATGTSSTISTDVRGVLLDRRQPEHVPVGVEDLLRDAAPEDAARLLSSQTSASPKVKTKPPPRRTASAYGSRAPPRASTHGSPRSRAGRSGSRGRSPGRSTHQEMKSSIANVLFRPAGIRSVRRDSPPSPGSAQLAREARAERVHGVVGPEQRLLRRPPGDHVLADQLPEVALEELLLARIEIGAERVPALARPGVQLLVVAPAGDAEGADRVLALGDLRRDRFVLRHVLMVAPEPDG